MPNGTVLSLVASRPLSRDALAELRESLQLVLAMPVSVEAVVTNVQQSEMGASPEPEDTEPTPVVAGPAPLG